MRRRSEGIAAGTFRGLDLVGRTAGAGRHPTRTGEESEGNADREVDAAGGKPVILRVAKLALGARIAPVAQIPSVDADLPAVEPVAAAHVDGGERLRQRGVPFVEIPVAQVFHDDIADEA